MTEAAASGKIDDHLSLRKVGLSGPQDALTKHRPTGNLVGYKDRGT